MFLRIGIIGILGFLAVVFLNMLLEVIISVMMLWDWYIYLGGFSGNRLSSRGEMDLLSKIFSRK